MAIGNMVKELREERGINQQELADAANLTQATISRIESGRVEQLKSDALQRLADALQVTMDYLVGRAAEISPSELLQSDPEAVRLVEIYEKLSPEHRSKLVEFAWFLRFAERVDLEQLDHLQDLVSESGEGRGVDRQIAILRTLAKLEKREAG